MGYDRPSGFLHQPADAAHRRRQVTLLIGIIAGHAMLAAWILMSSAMLRDQRANTTLVMAEFSKDDIEPDAPAKPVEVAPVPDVIPVLLGSNSKLAAAPDEFGNGDGNGCSVANAIGAALISDEDAMKELAALPAGVRSDADAVMLWNGAWLEVAVEARPLRGDRGIPELRRVVTAAVQALPAGCAEVETVGPQLIPVTESGRTTMVVIGSGVWRWAALVDPPGEMGVTPFDQPVSDWLPSWLASGN